MAAGPSQKQERLEARITPEQKDLLQQAAAIEGTSLSDFVVRSGLRAAEQTIHEHSVLVLNARASRDFVDALLSPPPPNEALRMATKHYKRVMQKS